MNNNNDDDNANKTEMKDGANEEEASKKNIHTTQT